MSAQGMRLRPPGNGLAMYFVRLMFCAGRRGGTSGRVRSNSL